MKRRCRSFFLLCVGWRKGIRAGRCSPLLVCIMAIGSAGLFTAVHCWDAATENVTWHLLMHAADCMCQSSVCVCVCPLPQGTIASSLTCVQLHKRAEKIAAMLAERGHLQDGDHVALVYPPGKHWQQVSLLYLCLCGDTAGCHRFTEIPQIFKIKADLNQKIKSLEKCPD